MTTADENMRKLGNMIKVNRRITVDGVAEELGFGYERAHKIINDILGYRKVSGRCVPPHLTPTHMKKRMAISLEHFGHYQEDRNDFCFGL
ncbi:histone-lysine N-methyltransferase SETMAR [Trichonephila clavata]|uniref:Histone-lysine N-methyltransferase SETMAR n=1 Tax=Trichonephila clavata TaxID=2740835 RepID=A0A8X6I1M2_TRICU|nr:histone-lysine N-methyltransferase SETMAR [Trichonephila clavata]